MNKLLLTALIAALAHPAFGRDEYMCGAGALMAGVALKGTVVKLAD